MGSIFFIVVPIRSYEFRLRLMENDIFSLPVTPILATEDANQEQLLQAVNRSFKEDSILSNFEDEDEVIDAKDIMLPAKKDNPMAYKIDKDGAKMLLYVTRDTVKLTHLAKLKVVSIHSLEVIKMGFSDVEIEATAIGSRSSRGSNGSVRFQDTALTELINNHFLEKHVEDALTKFDLLNAGWEHSIDENFSTITFTVKADRADEIINHLHQVGIGKKYHSTLCVCSTSVFTQEGGEIVNEAIEEARGNKWNEFVQSIKARLTVAQVVQNVKADAVITFDFIIMVIVAGIIASIGLLDSSPVNLIASMLVSPLMGPIMAFTFGAMIRDLSLIKTGVVSELWGLFICLLVGFVIGIFIEYAPVHGPWDQVPRWPTSEMFSRSQFKALIVGAGIAIPSGAGVALSILAGNSGSLVGVAISASLLPPCVNCGIFYGMALVIAIQEAVNGRNPLTVPCDESLAIDADTWRDHTILYCQNALREYGIMGTISLCLTLLNIILIFLTGLVVLKIKEVAPYTTKKAFERFWKHDLRQARDFNREHNNNAGEENALLEDIEDNAKLLNAVQDDFVFNQIKNRALRTEETINVIETVKNRKKSEKNLHSPQTSGKGWFSWFGSAASAPTDIESSMGPFRPKSGKIS